MLTQLTKEYKMLLEKEAAGEAIDDDRMYFLDLVDRKDCGEELTDIELEDWKLFQQQEERKELKEEAERQRQLEPMQQRETMPAPPPSPLPLRPMSRPKVPKAKAASTTKASSSSSEPKKGKTNTKKFTEDSSTAIVDLVGPASVAATAVAAAIAAEIAAENDVQATVVRGRELQGIAEEGADTSTTDQGEEPTDPGDSDSESEALKQKRVQEESNELDALKEAKSHGDFVDEKRIYELQLYDRERRGLELSQEEQEDLLHYKKFRRREHRYLKEYEELIRKENSGEEIDQDRMYFLDLVDQKHCGEQLSDIQLEDLDHFYSKEEEKELEKDEKERMSQLGTAIPQKNRQEDQSNQIEIVNPFDSPGLTRQEPSLSIQPTPATGQDSDSTLQQRIREEMAELTALRLL